MPIEVSKEVLDKVIKDLQEVTEGWDKGVNKGAIYNLKGAVTKYGTTECHYWLNSGSWRSDTFLVGNSFKHIQRVPTEDANFLQNWMVTDSPFAEFIVNREDPESLATAGQIYLCGQEGLNLAQTMWCCKVMRMLREGGKSPKVFRLLCEAGVKPTLALYISQYHREFSDGGIVYTGTEGHSTVARIGTSASQFFQAEVRKAVGHVAETGCVFTPPTKEGSSVDAKHHLQSFSKAMKKPDGWGGFIEGRDSDPDTFIERVLEFQRDLEEVFGEQSKPRVISKDSVYLDFDV